MSEENDEQYDNHISESTYLDAIACKEEYAAMKQNIRSMLGLAMQGFRLPSDRVRGDSSAQFDSREAARAADLECLSQILFDELDDIYSCGIEEYDSEISAYEEQEDLEPSHMSMAEYHSRVVEV